MANAGDYESRWTTAPLTLWLGYRTAATNLGALLAAVLVVFVPIGVLSLVGILAAIGRDAAIVNGELQPVGTALPPALVVVVAAILVLAAAANVVVVAANVFVVAGALLGRPVGWRAALRSAVRRWRTLLGLLATAVLALAVVVAASFAAQLWLSRIWVAVTVAVVLLLVVLRFSLALPLAVLEGHGMFAALGRAYRISRRRTPPTVAVLLVGVVGAPVLAELALRWAVSPLDGLGHAAAWETLRVALALAALPFQAATLTALVLVLGLRGSAQEDLSRWAADLDQVEARLPAEADGPAPRTVLLTCGLVVGLLLPGLIYSGYLWVNPMRLVVADQQEVTAEAEGEGPLTIYPGGDSPLLVDGPPTRFMDLYSCLDPTCGYSRTAELNLFGQEVEATATARLPDGSLAVAARERVHNPETDDFSGRLTLFACQPENCRENDMQRARTVATDPGTSEAVVAMATGPGGLVIAHTGRDDLSRATLRLTRCDNVACADPRTVRLAEVRGRGPGRHARPLAVAIDRSDRPVVAYLDTETGALSVLSCDSPACQDPTIRRPLGPVLDRDVERARDLVGVDLALDRQGRPVLAYRHFRTGAAMLLTCALRACERGTETRLTGPGWRRPAPRVTLDGRGNPLVATYDITARTLVLVACDDTACRDRGTVPLAEVEQDFGHLDIAMGADGRPRIVWTGVTPGELQLPGAEDGASVQMITCAHQRCRPGA